MNDTFEKFTERARKVLSLAQEEAQRFNHNYIGTEHLLLGLVREGDGVAAKVLSNLGVELNKVRSAVEFIIGRGDRIVLGEIGLTPRAKKVIELAVDEARRLNHHYIGTEHLLLGLVREGEGIAAGVLESLGVNLERVRTATLAVLSRSGTTVATGDFAASGEVRVAVPWGRRSPVFGAALRARAVEQATIVVGLLLFAFSVAASLEDVASGTFAPFGLSTTGAALLVGGISLIEVVGLLLAQQRALAGYAICLVAGAAWATFVATRHLSAALGAPSFRAGVVSRGLVLGVVVLGILLVATSVGSLVVRTRLRARFRQTAQLRRRARLAPPPTPES